MIDPQMQKILEIGGRAAANLDKEMHEHPMADKVTHQDVLLMVQAALQMAQRDSKLETSEKNLIARMVKIGRVNPQELAEIKDMSHEDIGLMIDRLSGKKARKAFLLTLVAVAMADEELEASEKQMIESLTEKLGVGHIDLSKHNFLEVEDLVMKFVASAASSR